MSILLSFRNLNLAFGQRHIFQDSEFTINRGDKIGLIGLNGHGKSTLLKILMEEVSPDISAPPFTLDRTNEKFSIFYVPQEINLEDYKDLTPETFFLIFYPELLDIHRKLQQKFDDKLMQKFEDLKGWEIQNSYLSFLKGFGFFNLNQTFNSLSGGEQKKMALSAGLSSNAELVLWDEPTNHLDIESIEKFEDELMTQKNTYMIISHDRYLLNHTTNQICHIQNGKIISFQGNYLNYLDHLEAKEKELEKNLDKLQNKHRRELAWMRQGIKARGTRSKKRVEGYHNINTEISRLKSLSRKTTEMELIHSGRKTKKLIEIQNGQFSYDENEILENLNLIITKKDKIALIGANGSGKSTLVKLFTEKLKLNSGNLKIADNLKIIVFDQHRESLDSSKTPLEVIGDENDFVILGDGRKVHVNSYLGKFLFSSDQVNRPISTLSGGEKNRLQLAQFMKQSADIWIFDEPTNDLDIETIEILEGNLKSYDAAVVIIGHDRAFLDKVCNKTWLIHDKKLEIFEGGYTQVAPFLHALELERENHDKANSQDGLERSEKKSTPDLDKQELGSLKKKMTYQEKQRFKIIDEEVSKAEQELEKAEQALGNFDFGDMNSSKQEEYDRLNKTKNEKESNLEKLYEEWEHLNSF